MVGMKEEIVSNIISDERITVIKKGSGRLKEQSYFLLKTNHGELFMSLYPGRSPHYRPFAELFAISDDSFYGSDIEEYLISLFAKHLGPGGKLFVAYGGDIETARYLSQGVPAPLTRLGKLMLKHGFRWFKDWYFAEGFMEGDQKLQAELPLDKENEQRQMENIKKEIREYDPTAPEKDNNR